MLNSKYRRVSKQDTEGAKSEKKISGHGYSMSKGCANRNKIWGRKRKQVQPWEMRLDKRKLWSVLNGRLKASFLSGLLLPAVMLK
jgi:hypothetical protein